MSILGRILGHDGKVALYHHTEKGCLIFPTGLHQSCLFVFGLRLTAPLRSFILAVLFFLVSFFFGLMHRLGVVLCRGVDGVENL